MTFQIKMNSDQIQVLRLKFQNRIHFVNVYENNKYKKVLILISELTETISDIDWIIIANNFKIPNVMNKIELNQIITDKNYYSRRMITFWKVR